ncbi:MAG TPA: xylulokinase [Thermoleophilaceae bacterium]|nr:xylulokinase [Thermoleophilaceae bacterium]
MQSGISIGLDIGTSGARALVMEGGEVLSSAAASYPLRTPEPGHAEQSPDGWWDASRHVLAEAWVAAGRPALEGIGLSGQMHGTVLVDDRLDPVRDALLWCDSRAAEAASTTERERGRDWLIATAGNPPQPGFTAPQMRFLAGQGDPALGRARWVLCAKDFVRARLTGAAAAEHSDASGTGLYSPASGDWSDELVSAYGVDRRLLPPLVESVEAAGEVTPAAARACGLPAGVPVAAGAADNAAAALGAGVVDAGDLLISVGTSGTLLAPLDAPAPDPSGACHLFRHAPRGRWYALAVALDVGGALAWWQRVTDVPIDELAAEAAHIAPGSAGMIALPYLSGSRMPVRRRAGVAALTGVSMAHGRGHVTRAVIESAAYALADGLGCLERIGVAARDAVVAGGAARHRLWRDVLSLALPGLRLRRAPHAESAAVGAALLGSAAAGAPLEHALGVARASADPWAAELPPAAADAVAAGYERFRALSNDPLLAG